MNEILLARCIQVLAARHAWREAHCLLEYALTDSRRDEMPLYLTAYTLGLIGPVESAEPEALNLQ